MEATSAEVGAPADGMDSAEALAADLGLADGFAGAGVVPGVVAWEVVVLETAVLEAVADAATGFAEFVFAGAAVADVAGVADAAVVAGGLLAVAGEVAWLAAWAYAASVDVAAKAAARASRRSVLMNLCLTMDGSQCGRKTLLYSIRR